MQSKNKKGLKAEIYRDLKSQLLRCVYQPGSILNEVQLTEIYGVSRTPVREALSLLEMDGYIRILPKKGIYVTEISLEDVLQIFQTRLEIEPIALAMAVRSGQLDHDTLRMFIDRLQADHGQSPESFRLDMAMHLYLIEQCGNRYIIRMMQKLFEDNTRVVIASKQDRIRIHDAVKEHTDILESLLNKDAPEASAELLRTHINSCRVAALDYFCSSNYLTTSDHKNMSYLDHLKLLD